MENVLQPLAKKHFNTIRINSSSISSICRNKFLKILGSGMRPSKLAKQTTLIISNKEMENGFLTMLSGTLVASLLGSLLTGECVKDKILRRGVAREGEATIRTGHNF